MNFRAWNFAKNPCFEWKIVPVALLVFKTPQNPSKKGAEWIKNLNTVGAAGVILAGQNINYQLDALFGPTPAGNLCFALLDTLPVRPSSRGKEEKEEGGKGGKKEKRKKGGRKKTEVVIFVFFSFFIEEKDGLWENG